MAAVEDARRLGYPSIATSLEEQGPHAWAIGLLVLGLAAEEPDIPSAK